MSLFSLRFFFKNPTSSGCKTVHVASNPFADAHCFSHPFRQVHEEFWRGTLLGAVAEFSNRKPRGEITLVVQGVGNSGEFGVDTKTEISQDALEAVSYTHLTLPTN